MTEKLFRWFSFAALAFLLLVGIYSVVKPQLDQRQTVTNNILLQAQLAQLQQQIANQNQALAALYQDTEMKPIILRKFPQMFQPVQPSASNGIKR